MCSHTSSRLLRYRLKEGYNGLIAARQGDRLWFLRVINSTAVRTPMRSLALCVRRMNRYANKSISYTVQFNTKSY